MKLIYKWLIIILLGGGYAFFMGGIFYKNLFRSFFDEKLKQEIVALLYINQQRILTGLREYPYVVSPEEIEIFNSLSKDPRVIYLAIFNKYGQVRWSPDPTLFGKTFDEYVKFRALKTRAVESVLATSAPKIMPFIEDGEELYEIAMPYEFRGEIKSIISVEVSRRETAQVVARGMGKFYLGAIGVLAFIIGTATFFLYRWVLSPLGLIRENIDSLSVTDPSWPIPKDNRKDEIGDLEKSLAVFFERLKATTSNFEKDKKDNIETERTHWQQVLDVMAQNSTAFVLDGDNYVLASKNLDTFIAQNAQTGAQQEPQTQKSHHLLDIVTSAELLQLVNRALEKPSSLVNGQITLDQSLYATRVITLTSQNQSSQRTILFMQKT
ncbi:hypothetical protein ACFL6Y_06805 [Elusimicrobiota bacterium]